MSEQNPANDPYRPPDSGGDPSAAGGPSYGQPPPAPPPPDAGGGPYGSGAGPYGAGPSPGSPYGEQQDPLAGMPPLANRGKRLLARIIDALVVGIPVGIVCSLIAGFSSDKGFFDAQSSGTNNYWQQGVFLIVYLVYEGLMLSHSGQTVGKRLLRIRVAMLSNGAVPHGTPAWFRAGVYSLPLVVPCLGFLFWLLNVLFCTWDQPYHQCLHDKAARTVVVETG